VLFGKVLLVLPHLVMQELASLDQEE